MDQKQNRNFSWGNSSPINSFAYSKKDVVNYPVYFFRPVEIDGKLWVPQPVFPEMLNWDQQKGEFKIPSAFGPAQQPEPIQIPQQSPAPEQFDPLAAFSDEAPQAPVSPEPKLRPIPIKKAAPAAVGAFAGGVAGAGASVRRPKKVEFNAEANKFVAPKVQDKKNKNSKKAKTKTSQDQVVDFASNSVKAVKSTGAGHKFLRILLWILVVLFIYFEVMLMASKPNANGEVPLVFGNGVVQQDNRDMYPAINYGDLCFIGHENSYSVNSVIAYVNDNNEIVVHRYLGVDSSGNARAKGDTLKVVDDSFNRANIVGKVNFTLPFVGFLVSIFIDKIVFVLLVVSLIACYIWKAKRKHT